MKTSEQTKFLTRVKELVALGKQKKGVLEYKEIMDHFSDMELEPEQIEKIYEYLERQNIDVLGNIEEEEDPTDDLDLSLPEGINIDDPVRMYLKEIGKVP
ncbi:MAG: RNA polymerase sigma factor RpoD, partial [Epulopiscium sp.]|nr:RNA polymerase sigma factor RpoD [Candidatus Epulonipiscium sp.]